MGLYQVNGDAGDWMFNAGGIDAVVSPEVAPADPVPSDAYGFWPPKSKIKPWVQESLKVRQTYRYECCDNMQLRLRTI